MSIEKDINKIKSFQIPEKHKLEMIFSKYIDMEARTVILDITQFDALLDDIMNFYRKG